MGDLPFRVTRQTGGWLIQPSPWSERQEQGQQWLREQRLDGLYPRRRDPLALLKLSWERAPFPFTPRLGGQLRRVEAGHYQSGCARLQLKRAPGGWVLSTAPGWSLPERVRQAGLLRHSTLRLAERDLPLLLSELQAVS